MNKSNCFKLLKVCGFLVFAYALLSGLFIKPPTAKAAFCVQGAAIAITIDRSASMLELGADGRNKIEHAKDAMEEMVSSVQNSGTNTVYFTINSFGSQGDDGAGVKVPQSEHNTTQHVPLTNNYADVLDAIQSIRYVKPGTCIECGIRLANRQLIPSPLNKAVILLSDGQANSDWFGGDDDPKGRTIREADNGRNSRIDYWVVGYEGQYGYHEPTLLGVAKEPARYTFEPDPSKWKSRFLEILNRLCSGLPPTPTPDGISTPTPTPTPPSSTTIISIPNVVLNGIGDSADVIVSILKGAMNFVNFDIDKAGVATAVPGYDSAAAFQTTITAKSLGSTLYTASGTDYSGRTVGAVGNISVNNPKPWCQIKEGDIYAHGNVSCPIPPSCILPFCEPYLIKTEPGNSPGIAVSGQTIYSGNGQFSEAPYNYNIEGNIYSGPNYDYSYLAKKSEAVSFNNLSSSVVSSASELTIGDDFEGYVWLKKEGDLFIGPSNIDIGTGRVVLFVNGDLTIEGKINVTDGRGFFMAVVNGDIIVKPGVNDSGVYATRPDSLPELEGLYVSEGSFISETAGVDADQQLHVRGSVTANNFILEKGLPDNSQIPSEIFEFAPDQLLRLPKRLSRRQVIWREVAP